MKFAFLSFVAVVEVCYNTAQDELAEQTIFHRNEVHSSTVSRIVAYKAKGAELSGLGHAQVEDSTPFVDTKIALFFGVVNWESSPWWKVW